MAFEFKQTKIPGVVIIQPKVYGDNRGYFCETFKAPDFAAAGLPVNFVQDNESSSTKGVLRGLHFQKNHTRNNHTGPTKVVFKYGLYEIYGRSESPSHICMYWA